MAGINHPKRTLAERLSARHINVNAIAPGPFPSKMMAHTLETAGDKVVEIVPRKRIGEPADIAGAVIGLSSIARSYITGIVPPGDGDPTGALCANYEGRQNESTTN